MYTDTHTQWHINKETQRERRGERGKKAANTHHRWRYCIIDNVILERKNTNKIFEAIKNWSLTSSAAIASWATHKGKKLWLMSGSVRFQRKGGWMKKQQKMFKNKTTCVEVHSAKYTSRALTEEGTEKESGWFLSTHWQQHTHCLLFWLKAEQLQCDTSTSGSLRSCGHLHVNKMDSLLSLNFAENELFSFFWRGLMRKVGLGFCYCSVVLCCLSLSHALSKQSKEMKNWGIIEWSTEAIVK